MISYEKLREVCTDHTVQVKQESLQGFLKTYFEDLIIIRSSENRLMIRKRSEVKFDRIPKEDLGYFLAIGYRGKFLLRFIP